MEPFIFARGAVMKRTILAGASLFVAASALSIACNKDQPPPQQPQPLYGQGQYGPPQGQGDPNAAAYGQQPPPAGSPYGSPPPQGAPPMQGGQPQYGSPPPQGAPPQGGTMGAPPPSGTGAAPPAGADAATAGMVRLVLQPRAANEA